MRTEKNLVRELKEADRLYEWNARHKNPEIRKLTNSNGIERLVEELARSGGSIAFNEFKVMLEGGVWRTYKRDSRILPIGVANHYNECELIGLSGFRQMENSEALRFLENIYENPEIRAFKDGRDGIGRRVVFPKAARVLRKKLSYQLTRDASTPWRKEHGTHRNVCPLIKGENIADEKDLFDERLHYAFEDTISSLRKKLD